MSPPAGSLSSSTESSPAPLPDSIWEIGTFCPRPLDTDVQAYDLDFRGGSYAAVHPEYYRSTVIQEGFRAPDHGDFDLFAEVVPAAKRRGLQCYAWVEESSGSPLARYIPGFHVVLEVDVLGRKAPRPCFNNPDYKNWHLAILEDYFKSYDLDGVQWCSERCGPLDRLLHGPADERAVTCFCPHCRALARERGIDVERARAGFLALVEWNRQAAAGQRPPDGHFVTLWRILLRYPEVLAWEQLWSDSQHQLYKDIYGTVKAIDGRKRVGWHIWHTNSFSPFFRAEQDFAAISRYSDFIKPVLYNNCAGPRFYHFLQGMHRALWADARPEETYALMSRILGHEEAPLAELPAAGFSPEYVRRETARTVQAVAGRCDVYPGIDIDIPTGPDEKKTTPEDVYQAVLAAFEGGATGVVLSRKYSEMRLANLAGAGRAIRELAAGGAARPA